MIASTDRQRVNCALTALLGALVLSSLPSAVSAADPRAFGVFRNNALTPDGDRMTYMDVRWSNRLVRPLENAWWTDADVTVLAQCEIGMWQVLTLTTAPDTTLDARFPTNLAAWSDSVTRVVERYDGDGYMDLAGLACPNHHWHVEAEDTFWKGTIDEYLSYLAITRAAVLAADPTAKIITMGLSSAQTWNAAYYAEYVKLWAPTQRIPYDTLLPWQIETQRLLVEGSYDIVDLHLYETHNVIAGKVAWVRSLMPPDKAIWALEAGAPFYTRAQGYTDTLNSQATVQLYAECVANGIDRVAVGYLSPSPGNFDYTDQFINCSLTRWNPFPEVVQLKPVVETYSLMTDKLADFTSVVDASDRTGADETQYLYDIRFQTPRAQVDVVWSPSGPRTIRIPLGTSTAQVTHVVTRAFQSKLHALVDLVPVINGTVTITATHDPVFVEGWPESGPAGVSLPPVPAGLSLRAWTVGARVRIEAAAASGTVTLDVLDARGARVRTLQGVADVSGRARFEWDQRTAAGSVVAPGVYFLAARDARGRHGTTRVVRIP